MNAFTLPRLVRLLLVFLALPLLAQEDSDSGRKPVVWNNPPETPLQSVTHHALDSKAMSRTVGYTVYLPPDYKQETEKRYPVLYFLHGAGGNETSDGPAFSAIVDRMIKAGEVPPTICVFPNGGMSGYRNHPETGINVETMIIEELLPLIDRRYRSFPRRESRVIAGYSMGGGGAVRLALNHPDKFDAAASLAGSMVNRRSGELPPNLTVEALQSHDPEVRLLLVGGYKDNVTFASQQPMIDLLQQANYSFTFRTLRNVPHNLGLYYKLAGDDIVLFLLRGVETE